MTGYENILHYYMSSNFGHSLNFVNIRNGISIIAQSAGISGLGFGGIDVSSLLGPNHRELDKKAALYLNNCIPSIDIPAGDIQLLNESSIFLECKELLPGVLIIPFGFVCIGRTACGDVIGLDCWSERVYCFSYDKYNAAEKTISLGWNADFSGFLPNIPITRENIIATADGNFSDISEFINTLVK